MTDPVREQRAKFAKGASLGKRVGYSALTVGIVGFFIGLIVGYSPLIANVIVASMVIATIALVPAIIIAYGVSKAEREDPVRPDAAD